MNTAATYALSGFTGVIAHGWRKPRLVKDGVSPLGSLEARVHSGDYFVSLATDLDRLSGEATDYSVKVELENNASDLIHLQDNYYIIAKDEQTE